MHKNAIRLMKSDIVMENKDKKLNVNWGFWEKQRDKYKDFNIYIDEIHNLVSSRDSLSKFSKVAMKWISQIRKICGSSETSNIFLISQRLSRIDVAWRDLLQGIIYCRKVADRELIIIVRYHFLTKGAVHCVDKFEAFQSGNRTWNYRDFFIANDYFKFYDSYEILGESAYL